MHIVLRNGRHQALFAVEVDLASPPTIVHSPAGDGQVAHLDWDRALDDEHHLRRCPVCGCQHLFARKALPQLTGFSLLVLAAIVATWLFYGGGHMMPAVIVLAIVMGLDAAIYFFARRELVCYRCQSSFHDMPIRSDHPRWQKTLSQRYARERQADRATGATSPTGSAPQMPGDGEADDQPAAAGEARDGGRGRKGAKVS